jgi:hypothetical protein
MKVREVNNKLTNPKAVDFESETGRRGAERVKSLEVSRESRDISSSTHAVGD